jgi:hypothetical protein
MPSSSIFGSYTVTVSIGFIVALTGQSFRILTIGLKYIIRGGNKRHLYAKELVTTGMFSHCRNPLYLGNIIIITGLGIIANSLFFVVIVLPVFIFAYSAIVRAEEVYLCDKFGEAYRDYTRNVNRWVPNLHCLSETFSSMSFHWKRVLIKEYNATFIWLTGSVLIVMKNLYFMADNRKFYDLYPIFCTLLTVMTVLYFIVRYLKKSNRLRDT